LKGRVWVFLFHGELGEQADYELENKRVSVAEERANERHEPAEMFSTLEMLIKKRGVGEQRKP